MPLRVLIVADRAEQLAALEAAFAAEPRLAVEVAGSRAEASRLLRDQPFDVLLLDPDLPDGRGLHTLAGLLAKQPELPVVLLGGPANDPDLALEALRLGAQDCVRQDEIDRVDWWRVLSFARERKRHERFAVQTAHGDPRTGLPPAAALRRRFDAAAARAQRTGRGLALIMLALRGYAALRDEAGADVADRAVAAVAARLRSATRRSEMLAAAPPSGFHVLLEKVEGARDVEAALRRLRSVCREAAPLADAPVPLDLLHGYALWRPEEPVPFAMLECTAARMLRRGAQATAALSAPVEQAEPDASGHLSGGWNETGGRGAAFDV